MDLYDYQESAMNRLKNGSILYGEVGSGKSRTALAYYYTKVLNGELQINGKGKNVSPLKRVPLYIITTARKREDLSWEDECKTFRLSINLVNSIDMIPVVIDSWNCITKYVDVKDSFFIFDEQRVVGSGVWVNSFLKIVKNNKWILLSATPGDTWTDYIPVFIANGFYKNKTEFIREHVIYNRFAKYPKVDRYVNTGRLLKERNQILVPMHYKKETILHNNKIIVPYDETLYQDVRASKWNIYQNKPCKNASEMQSVLKRTINENHERTAVIFDLIKKYDRIIVFYNYNYELKMLRDLAESIEIDYAEWNGHKHELVPETARWLYLVQYTAGAEAWNCTTTNVMVFFSLSNSYRATKQASGRIDRVNTPYSDLYYYYISTNAPIDKQIGKSLHRKKDFNAVKFFKDDDYSKAYNPYDHGKQLSLF